MDLTSSNNENILVITVQEQRIDAAVALAFKDRMRELTEGPARTVVLDLDHVSFIDSSGLGAIVAAMKNLAPDRTLVLAGLTGTVDKVFRLTRMDTVFGLYGSVDDALKALRG
ncbi:STAS domain-containing protein [uncultured Sulfitobacter sp.]|uniref:STAS domain-containing protein n=1 Tax=uncultured Sulfitobacter sp. TaxID=191468 RepID=UPI002632DCCF|nr:STAS domain-containing protein [uncultured Sulfitobacter sp.]